MLVKHPRNPALIFCFNHPYFNNVDKLRRLYASRFSNVFFLMPYISSESDDCIQVSGNGMCFGSYIAQGVNFLKGKSFSHLIFVADDLLLNPEIDESNYMDFFSIKADEAFIHEILDLKKLNVFWYRAIQALRFNTKKPGVEAGQILADALVSTAKKNQQHLSYFVPKRSLYSFEFFRGFKFRSFLGIIWSLFIFLCPRRFYTLSFPLAGGYSDICIIPQQDALHISESLSALSSLGLHAELAIPTSLVMSSLTIQTIKTAGRSAQIFWDDETNPYLQQRTIFDALKLLENGALYAHPVKLSKLSL